MMKKESMPNNDKGKLDDQANVDKKFNIKSFFKKIIDEILYFISRIDI